ncbi:MarR family transcriptional regulator [Rhodoferax ferrireducens]|uniref:MarR family winged helix-turn-helix transcriptional regulator n=1 Tax=Rhodoferax ferrireducens TaxID=192843 RepID=UPI00298E47D3|nr:MarR family transcriptional regulator [Rhodoferax ferrireducens]WPC67173.1 MarR family transcriptional regulator [Rhodoferax ferrireducens]
MKGQALELISEIHLDWKRHVARALAPHGITPKQIFLLRKLKQSATLTPSEVAVLIHGDRPSTTSMLDTLERSSWICRQRDPSNGKRVIITLTDAGMEKLASVPERLWRSGKVPSDPESCLERDEREELTRLLQKMHRCMNANPQER